MHNKMKRKQLKKNQAMVSYIFCNKYVFMYIYVCYNTNMYVYICMLYVKNKYEKNKIVVPDKPIHGRNMW